jgi:hypothetical protein
MRFLCLIFIFLTLGVNAQSITTASWRAAPIVVDGLDTDWDETYRFSEYSSRMLYNIANDKQKLYFAFRTDDPFTIKRLTRYGIEIKIDTAGKKKSNFKFQFPSTIQYEKGEVVEDFTQSQMLLRASQDLGQFFVSGALGLRDSTYSTKSMSGISVAYSFAGIGVLIYEIAIPLSYIQHFPTTKFWNLSLEVKSNIKTIGNLKMPNTTNLSNRSAISNPNMNQNAMGQMGGVLPNDNMMNNQQAPPEQADDESVNQQQTYEMQRMQEVSQWKVKLQLANE